MASKKRLGLLYSYNESWIGGTYYILNIISALNVLPNTQKPIIILCTDSKENFKIVKNITQYPYLKLHVFKKQLPRHLVFLNRLSLKFIHKRLFKWKASNISLDLLYPSDHSAIDTNNLKKVKWIPDFQEVFLPHFFSEEDLLMREISHQKVAEEADVVVFSSDNAKSHFQDLFPSYTKELFVLNFAVTHPSLEGISIEDINEKYEIDRPYYFSPNQFWAHKNHITVIKAVEIAITKNPNILVLFSGKEEDYRVKGHVTFLKDQVVKKGLEKNIKFLGFLPREEQLFILRNSIAVIQPSEFEGWSTVVEDAKAQGKYVFLSNLPVHKEQMTTDTSFFEAHDADTLATYLIEGIKDKKVIDRSEYQKNIHQFAIDILTLINKAGK